MWVLGLMLVLVLVLEAGMVLRTQARATRGWMGLGLSCAPKPLNIWVEACGVIRLKHAEARTNETTSNHTALQHPPHNNNVMSASKKEAFFFARKKGRTRVGYECAGALYTNASLSLA